MIPLTNAQKALILNENKTHKFSVLGISSDQSEPAQVYVETDQMISESLVFTESICSSDDVKFGKGELSVFEVDTVGVSDCTGNECELVMDIDDTETSFPSLSLGFFIIQSHEIIDKDINKRHLIAYGKDVTAINLNGRTKTAIEYCRNNNITFVFNTEVLSRLDESLDTVEPYSVVQSSSWKLANKGHNDYYSNSDDEKYDKYAGHYEIQVAPHEMLNYIIDIPEYLRNRTNKYLVIIPKNGTRVSSSNDRILLNDINIPFTGQTLFVKNINNSNELSFYVDEFNTFDVYTFANDYSNNYIAQKRNFTCNTYMDVFAPAFNAKKICKAENINFRNLNAKIVTLNSELLSWLYSDETVSQIFTYQELYDYTKKILQNVYNLADIESSYTGAIVQSCTSELRGLMKTIHCTYSGTIKLIAATGSGNYGTVSISDLPISGPNNPYSLDINDQASFKSKTITTVSDLLLKYKGDSLNMLLDSNVADKLFSGVAEMLCGFYKINRNGKLAFIQLPQDVTDTITKSVVQKIEYSENDKFYNIVRFPMTYNGMSFVGYHFTLGQWSSVTIRTLGAILPVMSEIIEINPKYNGNIIIYNPYYDGNGQYAVFSDGSQEWQERLAEPNARGYLILNINKDNGINKYIKAIKLSINRSMEYSDTIIIQQYDWAGNYESYDLTENYALKADFTPNEISEIISDFHTTLNNTKVTKANLVMQGNPAYESGDVISITLDGEVVNIPILRRTLKGIQALTDTIESGGL